MQGQALAGLVNAEADWWMLRISCLSQSPAAARGLVQGLKGAEGASRSARCLHGAGCACPAQVGLANARASSAWHSTLLRSMPTG